MSDLRATIDAIRERTDLVQLIGRDLELRTAGSVMKARSPFREEKTPSFVVWPHTQTWRDFSGGSSQGGDCLDYVMARDGVPFLEAVHTLAESAGVEVPGREDATLSAELDRLSERRRLEKLLTEAARYYHRVLPSKVRTTWYAERYGFTDDTIERLQLGWADGHLFEHLVGEGGATEEDALATGLFVRFRDGRVADFFQQRLVFPYWRRGRVVYFIARQTDLTPEAPWEDAKYKKLLTRSEKHEYVSALIQNDTFYNEDAATRSGVRQLLVTEGVTDCISAMQAGVACLSPVTVRFRHKDIPKLVALTGRVGEVVVCNDSEASGAGEAGATETAAALHAAGRCVRIARIPLPAGATKVDVNELVKAGGAEALAGVIRTAVDWCEHSIEQIPTDAPKPEIARRLRDVLPLIRAADPVLRDAYVELVRQRFKLRAQTVRELLREPEERKPIMRTKTLDDVADEEPTLGLKGEVLEDTDHYFVLNSRGEPVTISSFHVEPLRRIVTREGDVIDADVRTTSGRTHCGVRFPRDAWHSKRQLLHSLTSVDMLWTGSDDNVQGVLKLITERNVPILKGVTNLGYTEADGVPLWIAPECVVAPVGATVPEDLVHIDHGDELHKRVRALAPVDRAREAEIAATVLPKLLELNTPEVVLPIIGWFFATPLKPRIHKALGHFPILCVWGTQGSGKSSIIMEVFWPLFGIASSEPFSATETEFALLKLLSSTNSVPVFIDEYKPYDMPKPRRHTLHRYMRRLFTGEVESRGRADQTVATYRLQAPLCLAGETRPIEPAVVERIITANPSKDTLPGTPQFVRAFQKLKTVDLGLLTHGIVQHLLGRDTAADLALAKRIVERFVGGREIPIRLHDNLVAVVCGLLHFEAYAASHGIALPDLDVERFVNAQCTDLLEGGGHKVKSGLDYFVEILSSLAVSGAIQYERQYTYTGGQLALHLGSCHAAYAEHCSRIGYEGEVLDKKALVRQLQEAQRRGGYVVEVSRTVSFGSRNDKRRAAVINLAIAKAALDVDDFPQPSTSSSTRGPWSDV